MSSRLLVHAETKSQIAEFVAKPSHALLLEGRSGLGKSLLALQLAADILDIAPDKLADYPYMLHATPVKDVIAIEWVRELQAFFSRIVPGTAKIRRIVLVNDVDTMTIPAQNAFLKLLEEPPADTVLILTSSKPQRLLPTIRSRVRRIVVHAPSAEMIREHFLGLGHDSSEINKGMLLSEGNIAQLSAFLAGESQEADAMLELVKKTLSMTSFERLLLVNTELKERSAASAYCDVLATIAHSSLVAAATKSNNNLERWAKILEAANLAADNLRKNASTKLVMTELLLSLS